MRSAVAVGLSAFALASLLEHLLLRQRPLRPSTAELLLRIGLFGWLFVAWLALWGEPFRAAFGAVATIGVMAGLSAGKRHILGEPLAFSDFGLIPLILTFPKLYLLEGWRLVAFWTAIVACCAIVGFGQPAEPLFGPLARVAVLAGTLTAILALPRLAAWPGASSSLRRRVPEPDPDGAVGRLGVLAALFVGWLRWAGDVMTPVVVSDHGDPALDPLSPDLVVVVQLESFVDPLRAGLSDAPLRQLDRVRARALQHGPLAVSAYGAFTMRSEHAVLTGLSERELGFRRLDPYLTTRGPAADTLATRLASRGWRTLFMHPFPGRFFNRRRVMPHLGFRDLHFAERFADCRRVGPYVSDVDFAGRIVQEAERADGPTLIMAVTMENHGPFSPHRGIGLVRDREQHLFHLRNTDEAIGLLLDGLSRLPRRVLLCLYGDHPPILKDFPPGPDPQTDYAVLLLGRDVPTSAPVPPRRITADGLGRLLLGLCGTMPARLAA